MWSITEQSVELTALDCRHPKGLSGHQWRHWVIIKDPLEGQLWSTHVLQYDRARTVPAVTFKLVKTRVFAYCGSFYHSKAHELEMSWSKRELVTIC